MDASLYGRLCASLCASVCVPPLPDASMCVEIILPRSQDIKPVDLHSCSINFGDIGSSTHRDDIGVRRHTGQQC